jgi:hypothetical protein
MMAAIMAWSKEKLLPTRLKRKRIEKRREELQAGCTDDC